MEFDSFLTIVLCVLLWPTIEAATETNVDTLEPMVIRSPARSVDPEDGFGWTAVLHQVELLQEEDTIDEAFRKTR